jgi:hypothetical protein
VYCAYKRNLLIFSQAKKSCAEAQLFLTIHANKRLALLAHLSEALAAVNGAIGLGLEGNLGIAATSSTGSGEVLTRTAGSSLAGVTAALAALGLVPEAALSVELLLTSSEHELATTLFAN